MGFVKFERILHNWTYSTCRYVKCYAQGGLWKRSKGIRKSIFNENLVNNIKVEGEKLRTVQELACDREFKMLRPFYTHRKFKTLDAWRLSHSTIIFIPSSAKILSRILKSLKRNCPSSCRTIWLYADKENIYSFSLEFLNHFLPVFVFVCHHEWKLYRQKHTENANY